MLDALPDADSYPFREVCVVDPATGKVHVFEKIRFGIWQWQLGWRRIGEKPDW